MTRHFPPSGRLESANICRASENIDSLIWLNVAAVAMTFDGRCVYRYQRMRNAPRWLFPTPLPETTATRLCVRTASITRRWSSVQWEFVPGMSFRPNHSLPNIYGDSMAFATSRHWEAVTCMALSLDTQVRAIFPSHYRRKSRERCYNACAEVRGYT